MVHTGLWRVREEGTKKGAEGGVESTDACDFGHGERSCELSARLGRPAGRVQTGKTYSVVGTAVLGLRRARTKKDEEGGVAPARCD